MKKHESIQYIVKESGERLAANQQADLSDLDREAERISEQMRNINKIVLQIKKDPFELSQKEVRKLLVKIGVYDDFEVVAKAERADYSNLVREKGSVADFVASTRILDQEYVNRDSYHNATHSQQKKTKNLSMSGITSLRVLDKQMYTERDELPPALQCRSIEEEQYYSVLRFRRSSRKRQGSMGLPPSIRNTSDGWIEKENDAKTGLEDASPVPIVVPIKKSRSFRHRVPKMWDEDFSGALARSVITPIYVEVLPNQTTTPLNQGLVFVSNYIHMAEEDPVPQLVTLEADPDANSVMEEPIPMTQLKRQETQRNKAQALPDYRSHYDKRIDLIKLLFLPSEDQDPDFAAF